MQINEDMLNERLLELSIAVALPDVEFTSPGRVYGGYVYDVNSEPVSTAIQVAYAESIGRLYPAYCVDADTRIDRAALYRIASEDSIRQLFDPNLVKKLRWIANHSFPFIPSLADIDKLCGSSGITYIEAVAATQAAIWSLTNPTTFFMGTEANGNSANIMRLYNYLSAGCDPGWDLEDVKKIGEGAKISLIPELSQGIFSDEYIYGPISVQFSHEQQRELLVELTTDDSRFVVCDEQGQIVVYARPGEKVYLHGPKDACAVNVCITANAQYYYGADFVILTCVDGVRASQAIGVVEEMMNELTEELCIEFSKLIIRKRSCDECANSLEGAQLELYSGRSELLDVQETNDAGTTFFCGLLPGKYRLKETKAPEGYELPNDHFEAVVTQKTTILCVWNKRKCNKCKST